MRILIAGIIGGLVMFFWGAISHMMLPLGEMGVKTLPNEAAVVSAMKSTITEPGFYFIPGMDMSHTLSPEEQAAWNAKYEAGPTAILVYNPTGATPMAARNLGLELASNILAALFAAIVISWLVSGFFGRVAAAGIIGLIGWLSISASYWNWYRFPTDFVTAELIDQVVGWLLSGVAIALILKSHGDRR